MPKFPLLIGGRERYGSRGYGLSKLDLQVFDHCFVKKLAEHLHRLAGTI